jgi:hypothetical protein
MIMSGTKESVLVQIQLVDIHGTRYYDIVYRHKDDQQSRSARIGADDIYENPQPGDTVHVVYVMNVVTGMQRAT